MNGNGWLFTEVQYRLHKDRTNDCKILGQRGEDGLERKGKEILLEK